MGTIETKEEVDYSNHKTPKEKAFDLLQGGNKSQQIDENDPDGYYVAVALRQIVRNAVFLLSRESQKSLIKELETTSTDGELEEDMTNERFMDARVCPHCGCMHISKIGFAKVWKYPDFITDEKRAEIRKKRDELKKAGIPKWKIDRKTLEERKGKRRYKCNDCGKTFTITTNSIFFECKLNYNKLLHMLECMSHFMSVKDTSEKCKINPKTVFAWRHRILDLLRNKVESNINFEGIVEADEAYFRVSFKGLARTKSENFKLLRKPHKSGVSKKPIEKDKRKRGLSRTQVCVPCAIDRHGHSIGYIGKLGKSNKKAIDKALGGRIEKGTDICTDNERAYVGFVREQELERHIVDCTKRQKSLLGINHINQYHGELKRLVIDQCRGVPTKYLENYIAWHNHTNNPRIHSKIEKEEILKRNMMTLNFKEIRKGMRLRPVIPLDDIDKADIGYYEDLSEKDKKIIQEKYSD